MTINSIIKIQPIINNVFPTVLFFLIFIIMAIVKIIPRIINKIEVGEPVIILIKVFIKFSKENSIIIPLLFLLILLCTLFVLYHHF